MSTKILIAEDKSIYESGVRAWNTQKERVQVVIDLYNKLGFEPLQGNDLGRLVNDTTNFLFNKMTNGQDVHLVVGNSKTKLAVDKEPAMAMLQKPDGYKELIAGIAQLVILLGKGAAVSLGEISAIIQPSSINNHFYINEIEDLDFTEKTAAMIGEYGKRYVGSEVGILAFNFVSDVVKLYYNSGIKELLPNYDIPTLLMEVIQKMDDKNKTFEVNVSGITNLRR